MGVKSMFNADEAALFSSKANAGLCSHAYIIDGASGIGKLDFALYCAQAMLCTEPNKPCGYCESCRKAKNGDHPDIFIIGKDKTAAIADVRELIRRSSLKPNDSDKQIFIVCNAGKLREDSQNALLKIIEEPPQTVAIFMLTESRSSLLPTVLSRGQRIHLDGRRDTEIAELLRDKCPQLGMSEIEAAVDFASGNLGEAENFLSKETALLRSKAENLLSLALGKKSYELTTSLLVPKFKREQLYALLSELLSLCVEAEKEKYGIRRNYAPRNGECAKMIESASKRALAAMGEATVSCLASLENNANVTAAASKLSIELLSAATK